MNPFYLLWVNIEYFGSISTSYSYKSTWIHFSRMLKKRSLYIPFSQTCRKTLPKAKLEECIGVCFERFLIKTTQVLTPYI